MTCSGGPRRFSIQHKKCITYVELVLRWLLSKSFFFNIFSLKGHCTEGAIKMDNPQKLEIGYGTQDKENKKKTQHNVLDTTITNKTSITVSTAH